MYAASSFRSGLPSAAPTPQTPPLQTSSRTTSLAAPAALDSAALHTARGRYGMNDIATSVLGRFAFLRYTLVSPTTGILLGTVLYTLWADFDFMRLLVLAFVFSVRIGVAAYVARTHRGWAAAVHRCFPHSSAVAYREGTWALVGAAQLLPGDLVQLVQGCVVPADCTLYRGAVLVDVSQLTGQTALVVAEPGHLLKAGSTIADGSGSAVMRYTNFDTFVGQTVQLMQHLAHGLERPAVQRAYLRLCSALFLVVVTAEIILYGVARGRFYWTRLRVLREMVLYAWLCLPLNLDLAVLQAASSGAAAAMAGAQAVVLRLGSLLALASVDRLVVDKTGTLTTGDADLAAPYRCFSPRYASRDSLVQLMALATKWREPTLHAVRRAVLRRADLDVCDHFTQLAYVEHAGEHRTSTVLRQSDGTLLRVTEGQVRTVLALLEPNLAPPHPGRPHATTQNSKAVVEEQRRSAEGGDTHFDGAGPQLERLRECAEAQRLETAWAYRGLRTRAVAVGYETGPWQLAGLLTFEDVLRSDAAELMKRCAELRVGVTMASGDARAVVTTVAAALLSTEAAPSTTASSSSTRSATSAFGGASSTSGSGGGGASASTASSALFMMTGADLPSLDTWQMLNAAALAAVPAPAPQFSDTLGVEGGVSAAGAAAFAACRVYAEMQPEHKVTLVRLLQQCGLRVGVVGDGVNDAAAAHVADVGLAVVTPERGPAFPSQGALWGADVALPATKLMAICELIAVSRATFATVYYLFFYACTTILQVALLLLIGATVGLRGSCADYHRDYCGGIMTPVNLYAFLLVFLNVCCLFFQARQGGDGEYWARAPCHVCYRMALLQAAAMAVIGAAGGTPLVMGLARPLLGTIFEDSNVSAYMQTRIVVAYVFYTQFFLSLSCSSPVRCGVWFVRPRAMYILGMLSFTTVVMFCLICAIPLTYLVLLLCYAGVVGALQDAVKLIVHGVCYRGNYFRYRACVDHMAGSRGSSSSSSGSGGGGGRRGRSGRGSARQHDALERSHQDNTQEFVSSAEVEGRRAGTNGQVQTSSERQPNNYREGNSTRQADEVYESGEEDGAEDDDATALETPLLERESSEFAQRALRPFSSSLNALLGCLASLEVLLLQVAPLRLTASTDAPNATAAAAADADVEATS